MTRVIVLLGFALAMFSAAAGASWWWQQQQHAAATDAHGESASTDGHASTDANHAASSDPHATADSGHAATDSHATSDPHAKPTANIGLPVAVRARPMSVEELLRYGLSLNAREESLVKHEDEFRQREARLKLALADLQGEQASIDGLRTQVQQQLTAADGIIAKIQQERQDLAREQAEAKAAFEKASASQSTPSESELANIKRMASWIRAMEPAKAAELLREMSNDGRLETAARILSHLEERDAARVLDGLGDAALVDDLISEYQKLRPEAKPAKKR